MWWWRSKSGVRRDVPWIGAVIGDEQGSVLVYTTVILGVLMGFGVLVIDAGRLASLQSELQSFADHVALAAAGELDGNPGAIARARTAAGWITGDRQTFGQGGAALAPASDVTLRFLSELPASDDDPITNAFVTTDDQLAANVEVTVTPRQIGYWMVPAFAVLTGRTLAGQGTAGATAVAGFTQYLCDIAPLMMCSPNGAAYTPVPGRQILLKSQNFWGPGAFGLLDVNNDPDGPCGAPNQGANYWRCVLGAIQGITRCFARRGVNIRTGQMSGAAAAGLNTRFDIYENNLNGERNNANFAPAPNVVKGIGPSGGGNCIGGNVQEYVTSDPLPRDVCFASDTCANGNRFGNGIWDKAGYWLVNHGGTAPAAATRYELYLYEIANAPSASRILPAPRTETGRPRCSGAAPADAERRLLNGAVIDCSMLPPGNASGVPVLKFVRLFLTEPAGIGADIDNTEFYVEEVGEIRPGGTGASGLLHELVQLYR